MKIEAEAARLNAYFNKIISEYKKVSRKSKMDPQNMHLRMEIDSIKSRIEIFQNEYHEFIKVRKNSFGRFNAKKFTELNSIASMNHSLPISYESRKEKKNIVEVQVVNESLKLREEHVKISNDNNLSVLGNFLKKKDYRPYLALFNKHKKLMKKYSQNNKDMSKQRYKFKVCDRVFQDVINLSLYFKNSRNNTKILNKDIIFSFKTLYNIDIKTSCQTLNYDPEVKKEPIARHTEILNEIERKNRRRVWKRKLDLG